MMEAAPSSALVGITPDLLLPFEEGPPGKQVVIRFGCAVGPLDQQPLFSCRLRPLGIAMRRAHAQAGKARGQVCIAALPPVDLLPGIDRKLQGQRLDRDRLKPLVATLADGTPATP